MHQGLNFPPTQTAPKPTISFTQVQAVGSMMQLIEQTQQSLSSMSFDQKKDAALKGLRSQADPQAVLVSALILKSDPHVHEEIAHDFAQQQVPLEESRSRRAEYVNDSTQLKLNGYHRAISKFENAFVGTGLPKVTRQLPNAMPATVQTTQTTGVQTGVQTGVSANPNGPHKVPDLVPNAVQQPSNPIQASGVPKFGGISTQGVSAQSKPADIMSQSKTAPLSAVQARIANLEKKPENIIKFKQ